MRKGYLVNYIYYIINEPERDLYIIENKITGEKRLMRLVNNRGSIRTLNILSKIKHPGLPVIDEIIEHEGDFYCIYEYPESESLENITIKSENSFTVEDACSFALEIAYAINLLHSQLEYPVLHLCILPSGIIVTDENKIRLRDYGLAFSQNNQEDTVTENFTDYEFLPPEIVNKEGCFIESDIYMIGMILKSMVYEKIKTSRIPDSIGRIITKSTMINPVDRYCNTGELIKELEEATDQFSKYNDISDISNPQSMLKDIVRGPCYTNTEYSGENINLIQPAQEVINSRIICVWNNSSFAAEMASVLAKKNSSVLLIDTNLLSPEIDLTIKTKSQNKKEERKGNVNPFSSLMEDFEAGTLTSENIRRKALKADQENIYCICGNYKMEDYEFYSTQGLVEIIRKASESFDYVIMTCSKFIYDEFTCVSLMWADTIFIPVTANRLSFREYNRYISFMNGRKQLKTDNIYFVGYEYKTNEDFSFGVCDELCEGRFSGIISYCSKRRSMTGSDKPYSGSMDIKTQKQYLGILKRANLM